eukprot:scaffold1224_cov191-Pinguiococcus_pyrenoidosus.AAC.11
MVVWYGEGQATAPRMRLAWPRSTEHSVRHRLAALFPSPRRPCLCQRSRFCAGRGRMELGRCKERSGTPSFASLSGQARTLQDTKHTGACAFELRDTDLQELCRTTGTSMKQH